MEEEKIAVFLEEAKAFPWFENSGIPNEKYHMFFSLYESQTSKYCIPHNPSHAAAPVEAE